MSNPSEHIDAVTTKLTSLVLDSNEVTGESDVNISSAVEHLVAGYGGGFIKTVGIFDFTLDETVDCSTAQVVATFDFYTPLRDDYASIGSKNGYYIYVISLLESEDSSTSASFLCSSEHFRLSSVSSDSITITYKSIYHKWCLTNNNDMEAAQYGVIIGEVSGWGVASVTITTETPISAHLNTNYSANYMVKGKYRAAIYRINMSV